jgi:hypothetical protein
MGIGKGLGWMFAATDGPVSGCHPSHAWIPLTVDAWRTCLRSGKEAGVVLAAIMAHRLGNRCHCR